MECCMATYVIDPAETTLSFAVRGLAPTRGAFFGVTGSVVVNAQGDPQYLEVAIPASSLTTGLKLRDAHLRSTTFFDVKQYPLITYASSAIERTGPYSFAVHGALNLHGHERPVRLAVTLDPKRSGRAQVVGVASRSAFAIPRSPFLSALMRLAIGDAVMVEAAIGRALIREEGETPVLATS
jgi:polyisoprenoid-binding protein YceI